MSIKNVTVVGGGFMGAGIAQCAAQAGFGVTLIDLSAEQLEKAQRDIQSSAERLHAKGKIADKAQTVLSRMRFETDLEKAAEADAVIEAVFERLDVKEKLLGQLGKIVPENVVIASNTSTIPIAMLGEFAGRPDKVVGMHFFSPVPVNDLLEIIPAEKTSAETLETAKFLGERFGKFNLVVKKDIPGFIMNRVYGAMTCEAMRLVESGAASISDVDTGLTTGYAMTLGPLAIADLAGLDVCLMAFSNIQQLDPGCAIDPPAILRRLVDAGKLGRKTGEGFYTYSENGKIVAPAF